MNNNFVFECVNCGKQYAEHEAEYLCPECNKENKEGEPLKGILKVVYDYDKVVSKYEEDDKTYTFETLKENHFLDILPISSHNSLSPLKVGHTPVYSKKINNVNVFFKYDALNPTFSFKDRASDLVTAVAKEKNIDTIITASTGNAASSLAGICASQNQKAILFVPAAAPKAKLIQIMMYGGVIVPIDGTYDDAFDITLKVTKEFGWYNRNTAYNPFTVEGKKSVSLELYEQFNGVLPDKIFVATGDGVILAGVYKGFEDLMNLGIIEAVPTIVCVQAAGSANLVNNLTTTEFKISPSNTIADSISVDIPRNYFMARDYLLTYGGEFVIVSDEEIMQSSLELSKSTGLFAEPAAATAYAGFLKMLKNGDILEGTNQLVLLTGSGLKDIKSADGIVSLPEKVKPNLDDVAKFLKIK